jgi:hypothetical protein
MQCVEWAGGLLMRGHLFDIVLIQVKCGSTRGPWANDCRRLQQVRRLYRAKSVVQFQWRKGESSVFSVLAQNLEWKPTTSRELVE